MTNIAYPQENPLLQTFDFPPFADIKPEHYEPALDAAMETARQRIAEIRASAEEANFSNTIEALEFATKEMDRISSILFNLHSAETSDALEKVTEAVSPKLSQFGNDIMLDEQLYARVAKVWENRQNEVLDHQQLRLLEKTYKAFKRNGASLNEERKTKLRAIDEELALASIQFGQVVLQDTNNYYLHLQDDQLQGLPVQALESARKEARDRGLTEGGVLTLQFPSYQPAMTYLKDRSCREELARAFWARGLKGEKNNKERIFRIAQLRHERATLLGYDSHAHFVLEERMAKKPETVLDFLNELKEKARPAALKELHELRELARADGLDKLEKWDQAYYTEKSKQARFALDSEKLKPYFPLKSVLHGAFEVAQRLYGLRFDKDESVAVYHEDVEVYSVLDERGRQRAWFYTDFFPRKGKRAGAWMTSYRDQAVFQGKEELPLVSIVCNFSPPGEKRPSLLSFQEVTTLFHEFGHALHGMLGRGKYPSLNGTHVHWDFVELPSQIMENWCYEEECLQLFARHYETNELIPAEEIERIRQAANHMEGLQTLRQLGFGLLDMRWHHTAPKEEDLFALEAEVLKDVDLLGPQADAAISTAFSHIFQGGYAAGYYSYKWAEVLDADAFELFKERGIFDAETAKRFRKILESGGQISPDELYREFRGRDADPDALLRRAGLLAED